MFEGFARVWTQFRKYFYETLAESSVAAPARARASAVQAAAEPAPG